MINRRILLSSSMAAALLPSLAFSKDRRKPHILLRSGWQVENIGDIAHTPGLLALLEKHLPEAEVTFWPSYHHTPEHEVTMLGRRFPKVAIVQGNLDEMNRPPAEIAAIMDKSDFFLHGSGPATIGWRECKAYKERTGKPFGVFGVTYGLYGKQEKSILNDASFVYFRDSVSLALAKSDGITAPIMEFGPDAVFALDVRNDDKATAYLKSVGLFEGQFLVCLPKHRITPMWLHELKDRPFDEAKHARNEAMKEHDHAPLLAAIAAVTRKTSMKVLIGHEDETQLPIGKEWLIDKLPDDVRSKVVWRDTLWQVDEAASIYGKSAGMFSNEMHSPIVCIAQGIPAIVCRWAEQSSKGLMWRDIGLGDWLFDFDNEDDVRAMPSAALELAKEPDKARLKAQHACDFVNRSFDKSMNVLEQFLGP